MQSEEYPEENSFRIFKGTCIFLAGVITCIFALSLLSLVQSQSEMPFGFSIFDSNISDGSNAPGDWIKLEQIKVTKDSITINIPNASLSSYAPTGSMKPVLDKDSNGIRIIPNSPEDINVGDIVTFVSGSDNIVHRVIEKGQDDSGYWFLTKGDNNDVSDGEKIRFENIRYVTIGVLY